MFKRTICIPFVLFAGLFLFACAPAATPTPAPTATLIPTATATATATLVPTATATPTLTPTITPIPTPTATPKPEVAPGLVDRIPYLAAILNGNADGLLVSDGGKGLFVRRAGRPDLYWIKENVPEGEIVKVDGVPEDVVPAVKNGILTYERVHQTPAGEYRATYSLGKYGWSLGRGSLEGLTPAEKIANLQAVLRAKQRIGELNGPEALVNAFIASLDRLPKDRPLVQSDLGFYAAHVARNWKFDNLSLAPDLDIFEFIATAPGKFTVLEGNRVSLGVIDGSIEFTVTIKAPELMTPEDWQFANAIFAEAASIQAFAWRTPPKIDRLCYGKDNTLPVVMSIVRYIDGSPGGTFNNQRLYSIRLSLGDESTACQQAGKGTFFR